LAGNLSLLFYRYDNAFVYYRDDRCVSDHGREVWFPYLDEELVAFIQSLPLTTIADLSLPPGVGDKRILRLAAQSIGINGNLIQLVKRAIQFGTLAAKQTSIQYYGSRRKGKGNSKI
jgi:asparagine synthetase B (glutamine-hydrolysing)